MLKPLTGLICVAALAACSAPKPSFDEFFPWDPARDGVQKTDSGLQYVVVEEGPEDGASPDIDSTVQVFYEGRLTDGRSFDGNFDTGHPSIFGVGQVIAGWTEGLQLMSEGDEFIFYIPSDQAYGQTPRPGSIIKPGDDLIFRVALEKVFTPQPADDEAWNTYTPWDASNPDVQKTGTGLEYVVLDSGAADGVSPAPDDTVVVMYEGRFAENGEVFDSSYKRGEPIMFAANGVIPGWQEALSLMKPGDRWLIHVPSDLAYGERGYPGAVPPESDLNFEVALIDVLPTE